jgi:hypothetical protein
MDGANVHGARHAGLVTHRDKKAVVLTQYTDIGWSSWFLAGYSLRNWHR